MENHRLPTNRVTLIADIDQLQVRCESDDRDRRGASARDDLPDTQRVIHDSFYVVSAVTMFECRLLVENHSELRNAQQHAGSVRASGDPRVVGEVFVLYH